ncbi:hypothetical protein BDQ17DRAFT_1327431 [Cyathus striatus]|nr:hypothetical protein BDQ17DRAFT_1327431 [Cyathus striatus]
MNQYKFSNVAEDIKSRNMPKVVEPTFITYDLQATFYEGVGGLQNWCALNIWCTGEDVGKLQNWYVMNVNGSPSKRTQIRGMVINPKPSISMSVPAKRTGVVGLLIGITSVTPSIQLSIRFKGNKSFTHFSLI